VRKGEERVDDLVAAFGVSHQLLNWLPQAWVRSTGHRRLAWIGAGLPLAAIWPVMPRSTRTSRVLVLS
jgi:hypothetical protein